MLLSHFSHTAIFTFKTTPRHLKTMTNLPNSIPTWPSTNFITPSLFSKPACMSRLVKLHLKLRIHSTLTRSFKFKFISSMNLKKWPMQSLSLASYLQSPQKLLLLRVASSTRKKNMKQPRTSSLRPSKWVGTSVTLPTTSLFASTRWNNWRPPWNTLLILSKKV